MEREMIEVTSATATKPDPDWRETDEMGHEHRFPIEATTREEETARWWCEDCHDEHVETTPVCIICGLPISPNYLPDPGPHYIPGLIRYYLNDEPITSAEYDLLVLPE